MILEITSVYTYLNTNEKKYGFMYIIIHVCLCTLGLWTFYFNLDIYPKEC